tara:strand:+ start:143 stop:631 length:489 start_codon:yes stop_codon:yes gene_type:complete
MLNNESIITTTARLELPAGEYVISDPCYTLGLSDNKQEAIQDSWLKLLDETESLMYKYDGHGGVMTIDNLPFAVFSTTYGDGIYHDDDGNKYYVDAGCIGCIPIELAEKPANGVFMHSYQSGKPFKVFRENGVINFGKVSIDTDPVHMPFIGQNTSVRIESN